MASRTIYLHPITEEEIQRRCDEIAQERGEDEDKEKIKDEALKEACFNFLREKMQVLPEHLSKLDYEQIFAQNKTGYRKVYIELNSEKIKNWLMNHCQHLPHQPKETKKEDRLEVEGYCPPELYERFMSLQEIAFEIRKARNVKTRVFTGRDDFRLKTKSRDGKWVMEDIDMNALAPVDLAVDRRQGAGGGAGSVSEGERSGPPRAPARRGRFSGPVAVWQRDGSRKRAREMDDGNDGKMPARKKSTDRTSFSGNVSEKAAKFLAASLPQMTLTVT